MLVPGYPGESNAPETGSKLERCKMSREGLHRNIKTLAALAGLDFFLLCILRIIKYRKKKFGEKEILTEVLLEALVPRKVRLQSRQDCCLVCADRTEIATTK